MASACAFAAPCATLGDEKETTHEPLVDAAVALRACSRSAAEQRAGSAQLQWWPRWSSFFRRARRRRLSWRRFALLRWRRALLRRRSRRGGRGPRLRGALLRRLLWRALLLRRARLRQ